MLSGKANLLKVLRAQEGDKVPWVPFVGVHAAKVLGVPLEEYLYSSKLIAKGVVESARLYNADGIPLCFDLDLEAEILGAKTKILPKMPPAIISHPLAKGSISDLPSYNAQSGRLKIALDAVGDIKAGLGEDCALYGLVCGVLTLAYQLRGRALLDDIVTNSKSLSALLKFCKDTQLQTIQAYAQAGVDVVAVVEPMCTNLEQGFFQDELAPLENELFECIRDVGLPSSFFLCGDVNALLEQICAMPVDNISVCSNVDLERLKDLALRANKSFAGNMNPIKSILNATRQEAINTAKQCLSLGGTKAYILSSGCDLAFDSPIENLQAISNLR